MITLFGQTYPWNAPEILLLAAAGYYWHSHKQDPEQITVPVYAEARVDLQVQGREFRGC